MNKRGITKRGQVTIFVVVAILIVAAVLLFVVIRPSFSQPKVPAEEAQKIVAENTQLIKDKVEGCMKQVVITSVNTLGVFGGLSSPLPEQMLAGTNVLPGAADVMSYALFYNSEKDQYDNYLPSLEQMKQEFLLIIMRENSQEFKDCINNFDEFKKVLNVKAGELTINVSNLDFGEKSGQIVMPFSYPVELTKQDAKSALQDFSVTLPINMEKIHETASFVVEGLKAIPPKSLSELGIEWANMRTQQLAYEPKSDKTFIGDSSGVRNDIPQGAGKMYNTNSKVLRIDYEREGYDPFYFYILLGEKT